MAVRQQLRDERRLDDDLGVRDELCRLGVVVAAEAEDRRWAAEPLREVRERGDADAAADEERLVDVEPVAVAERAEHVDLLARLRVRQGPRSGADGLEQEAQLSRRRLAEAHRPGKRPTRCLEHEELARDARVEAAPLDS